MGFYLVDYRVPLARNDRWSTPAQAKVTPFYFVPDRWNRPFSRATAVWITEAVYQALYDSGYALHLHVSTGGGRSWPHDAVITIFQRKRFSWPFATELNPEAE